MHFWKLRKAEEPNLIDLIRNELRKSLLRPFGYLPLLCCLAGFVCYFAVYSMQQKPQQTRYTDPANVQAILAGLQEGILSSTSPSDAMYEIEKYEYIQAHHLHIPTQGWQMSALNDAFHLYKKRLETTIQSPHQIADCYRYLKLLCQAAILDDSQSYLRLQAEQKQSDPSLSAAEKYHYDLYYSYMIAGNVIPQTEDWRNKAAQDLLESRLTLSLLESSTESDVPSYDRLWKNAYNQQAISEYQIAHELSLLVSDPQQANSPFWQSLFAGVPLLLWLQLPLLFFTGGMVSYEYGKGQLPLLLTCPVRRSKYFLSKLITMALFSTALTLLSFLLFFLCAVCLFGWTDCSAQALFVYDGQVISFGTILLLLRQFLFACISLFAYGSFVLLCSTLFSHTSLVWGIGLLYTVLSLFLRCQDNIPSWMTHTICYQTDLMEIFMQEGAEAFCKALLLLLVHVFLCLSGSFFCFHRKCSVRT